MAWAPLLLLLLAMAASHSAAFAPAPPSATALRSFRPLQGAAALRTLEQGPTFAAPPLRNGALIVRFAEEEGAGGKGRVGSGKDDILRKLAKADASKGPEPPPKKEKGALPEW